MRCRRISRKCAPIVIAAWASFPAMSWAATFTWNGADPNFGFMGQSLNWVGGTSPYTASNGTADLMFAATNPHNYNPTLNGNLDVNSLTFSSGAYPYTIVTKGSGASGILTIEAAGLTDNAANAEVISGTTPVVLNASQPWNVAGGTLTDSTPLNLSNSVMTLNTAVAAGSAIFSGTLSGTGKITKTGAGMLSLTGSGSSIGGLSAQGGAVQVSSGTLALTSSNAFGITSGTVTVINNGTVVDASSSSQPTELIDGPVGTGLTVRIGAQFKAGSTLNVGATGQAYMNVSQGATASVVNSLVVGSTGGSSLSITVGGSVTSPTGDVGITPGTTGTVTVDGIGSKWNFANLNIGGLNSAGGSGNVTVTSSGVLMGTGAIGFNDNSAVLNISKSARVTAGGLNSLTTGNGAITLTDPPGSAALTLTNSGPGFDNYSGSISGTGSVSVSGGLNQYLLGANTFTGPVTLQGGYLELRSGTSAGYFAQGGTLQLDFGNLGNSVVYSFAGSTVVYNTANITGGILVGDGAHDITAVSNFYGTTIDNGVSLTPSNGVFAYGVNSAGNITVPAARQFFWFGGSNAGNFNVSGTTILTSWNSAGILQINNGGSVNVQSSNLVLQGGSRTYIGSSTAPGGSLMLHSDITTELNGGLLVNFGNVSNGTVNVNYGGLATGTGIYSNVVVNPGGTYMPGNYGSSSPIPPMGSAAALIMPAASGLTSTGNPITTTTQTQINVNTGDTLTLAGGFNTEGNSVTKLGGGTAVVPPLAASSLNISAGTFRLAASASVLSIGSLQVGVGATLDVNAQSTDIASGNLSAITTLVQQGYNSGLWNGTGVNSMLAATDPKHLTAVAVIQNNQSGMALFSEAHTFEGVTPGASDILLKYTYYGDSNLDGKVDGSDYSRIDSAYLADRITPTAQTGWFNGDFNYDGLVDGSDYTLIDNAFNTQGAALTSIIATPTGQIAGSASVPEPACILSGTLVAAGLFRRRHRRVKI